MLLMLICIMTKNVITSWIVTMMLFLHLEVKPLLTLITVLYLSCAVFSYHLFFFFQAEDGIRDTSVTGVQTCALPILWTQRLNYPGFPCDDAVAFSVNGFGYCGTGSAGWTLTKTFYKFNDAANTWTRSEERRVGKEYRAKGMKREEEKRNKII